MITAEQIQQLLNAQNNITLICVGNGTIPDSINKKYRVIELGWVHDKKDMISFLGSDAHRTNQIYPKIPKILKKLSKIISEQKLKELTTLNAQKVLNDENI